MNIAKYWLAATLIALPAAVPAQEQVMYRAAMPAAFTLRTPVIALVAAAPHVPSPDPSPGWTLKLSGIWGATQPQSSYGLYLNLAPEARPTPEDPGYIGALSVYDLPRQYDPQHPRNLSYDLQPVLARLHANGRLNAFSSLTVVPAGPAQTGQTLNIHKVEIYRKRP